MSKNIDEPNFEKKLMPVENLVALGFMIHSAVHTKEMLDLGLMTPLSWILAAVPFILHIAAYNFLKYSATLRGAVNTLEKPNILNFMAKPFIGPVMNGLRLTSRS